jgi:hypothetical protein
MRVHHAGDAIESETVELILFHPEAQVAEQEAQNFVVTIIEESAIPKLMSALGTFVKVLMVTAIKVVEAVEYVLRSVTVHYIQ